MADVIEDFDVFLGRAINYLTRILYELCRRLYENSHRPLNRRTLVRWLAAFMPVPKKRRLKIQSHLAAGGHPGLDRWASCSSLVSAVSSVSINQLVEEELGDNIVRYRRECRNDMSSDILEDPSSLRLTMTSTPKVCSVPSRCNEVFDPVAKEKLIEMEEELAALRKQIAMLVMAQESSALTKTVTDLEIQKRNISHTADVPSPVSPILTTSDNSSCGSEHFIKRHSLPSISEKSSEHSLSEPPPPPPPPLHYKQSSSDHLTFSEQLKQGRARLSSQEFKVTDYNSYKPMKYVPDLATILKDLGSVKLKAVERSPGGTPMKRYPEREPTDPSAIIAQALKKKFSDHWVFSSESDRENESSSFSSEHSNSFGLHIVNQARKELNMTSESSDNWTPVASPLKV